MREIVEHLATWTPYLLGGFAMNILISVVAMAVGTGLGWGLALLRLSPQPRRQRAGMWITEVTRAVPTIVFQFYLAFMLPVEFRLPLSETLVAFPAWLKAALALAVAVVGFTSDNLAVAAQEWKNGNRRAAFLFIPSWTSYALIIVMASSTASIIGVSELVSRANTVINASGHTGLMLPTYLYASLLFFAFCGPLTLLMGKSSAALSARHATTRGPDDTRLAAGTDAREIRTTGV